MNSHRTGKLAHPMLDGQRWPPYWHYDRLTACACSRRPGGWATRAPRAAVADLRAAPRATAAGAPTGGSGEGRDRSSSGVEQVDWTADGSNKVLTIQALEVLRAAETAAR